MSTDLKQHRARLLGNLTRIRRSAFVIIDARGSRTQLTSLMLELDKALQAIENVTDEYVNILESEADKQQAVKYCEDAASQHREAVQRIELYLRERQDDPASVATVSQRSTNSTASRQAQINAQLKRLEAAQLERRLEQEQQEQELQRQRRLQEARDAQEAAELEARLTREAEDDLSWERRHDFDGEFGPSRDIQGEPTLRSQQQQAGDTDQRRRQPDCQPTGTREPEVTAAAPVCSVCPPDQEAPSLFLHSLPRLTLPKFSGEPAEWPRWFALYKSLVHEQRSLSSTEKMAHLQSAVTGLAQRTIGGMLYDGSLYEDAVQALQDRFGREEDVVAANLQAVFGCPPPTHLDPVTLERFHAAIHCAVTVFQKLDYHGDLHSFENLRRAVEKLPPELKRDWGEHVMEMEPTRPNLIHFDAWLRKQVRIALNYAAVSKAPKTEKKPSKPKKNELSSALQRTALTTDAEVTRRNTCICCGELHAVTTCTVFLQKTVDERALLVANAKCCFFCLKKNHIVKNCRFAKSCGVDGCTIRHHRMLHGSQRIQRTNTNSSGEEIANEDNSSAARVVATSGDRSQGTTLLQLVPVKIVGKNGAHKTVCALIDPGSQTSLCCEDIVTELGLSGESQLLRLQNVEGCGAAQRTKRMQMKVLPVEEGSSPITVPEVFSVKEIKVTVPYVQRRASWTHLQDVSLPNCDGKVELLLGANVLEAILQLEVRVGKPGQPVGIRTAFGWTLTGSVSDLVPGHLRSVMLQSVLVNKDDDFLQDWWTTESFGTKFEGLSRSQEDAHAEELMENTIFKRGDRYEVGLLWKPGAVEMPDNYKMAYRRLQSLERSLERDPDKAAAYTDTLMGYVNKNHARKVTPEEQAKDCPKRWLLPHHAVTTPAKPKVRVVFDAAAQWANMSLNKALMTGPDLLQNLVGVLIRFREERVALVADIEQMFHQIQVREEDQPALSFLWRDLDKSKPPDMYQMRVVIFGAKCSPTLANFVLRRTAEDHKISTVESLAAATAVTRNFYMDDFLKSEENVEKAKTMQKEVTSLVEKGGFHLTKWMSNSSDVMESIPPEERSSSGLDLSCLGQGAQSALGCFWKPEDDVLCVKSGEADVPASKRGVLRRVSMVFDPLGIVSPFTLRAKLLVQRLWTLKCDWDEPLTGGELAVWEQWLSELPQLQTIEIPRCFKAAVSSEDTVCEVELHIFCDASENAFGAVAYLRQVTSEGAVSTAFVMSRTRLAPLKQLTIVRLELQAAVLGVRLASFIQRELSSPVSQTFYWTDSQVVLQYLNNESRRYHTFVANRIAEIHESSHPSQWSHVPGHQNPADVCSRGTSATDLQTHGMWWSGPVFLSEGRENWPSQETVEPALNIEDPEVKKPREAVLVTQVSSERLLDAARYSSWLRYKRTVAWVMRFAGNMKQKKNGGDQIRGPLTVSEIQAAEIYILKESQRLTFTAELKATADSVAVPVDSSLAQLSPFLDEQGLLRARGRLHNATLPETTRHPVILDRDDDVTRLIVSEVHQRLLHPGLEHTLAEVRTNYWMSKARSTVKKIIHKCAFCRNRRASPQPPKMADLPKARFDTSRPFACVGIDFFGPLAVRKFRRTEKRYVLLITCLATRAVHLEVANSLDLDCFLMALRRFIARRGGRPRVIWSDNGTNLVAGEKEIRESLKEWNQARITDELSQRQIEWKFIPPSASHMGGVWERLVASTKRALRVVLGSQCVSDDLLQTVLAEVEFVINSRPLTYVSSDISDAEPLTPNHFLVGQPEAALPPGVFAEHDALGRKKWRHGQALTDHFWRRWQREYLPSLMERKKWLLDERDFQVGDVVLLVDDTSPRGFWPLARVTHVFPSTDGTVRSVEVQTTGGRIYRQPVTKVCFIEECQS